MKKSIRFRLFLHFSVVVLLVILVYGLLNCFVLEEYYSYKKKASLTEVYDTVNSYFNTYPENMDYELLRLDTGRNIQITVLDENYENVYSSFREPNEIPRPDDAPMPEPKRQPEFSPRGMDGHNINVNEFYKNMIQSLGDERYIISNSMDNRFNFHNISLAGKLDNGYYVFLSTPLETIQESVKISNEFLVIVGAAIILLAFVFAFFGIKKFVRPILEISDIAKNMAALDFSEKYKVTTQDEIGELGNSINILSENLEKTICKLQAANEQLEEDMETIKKADSMRKEFLANVSHELKTPLALVQGYAEGLRDNVVSNDENRIFYSEVILDEAVKMDKLVGQILDLTQLEFGKHQLVLREFDLENVVLSVIKKNALLIDKAEVKMNFEACDNTRVYADEFLIENVLINYLTNALHHVDERKIVNIRLKEDGNMIRICVENSGQHISDADLSNIWESFYKADKSRSRKYGGTGLGLAIVRATAENHKTNCGAYNTDIGVEFWFDVNKMEN